MRYWFILLGCCFDLVSCSQGESEKIRVPVIRPHQFQLGTTTLTIDAHHYTPARPGIVFLQLHDNEETGAEAAHQLLKERGGTLLSLQNNGERNVNFTLDGRTYCFDPNRIFTPTGLVQTLDACGPGMRTPDSVEAFSTFLTALLPDSAMVVAVHNNRPGSYRISSYLQELKKDAAAVFINQEMDSDDFVLTTHPPLFEWLQQHKISVVLQNNQTVTDDGSLSVLFGRLQKPYANIEAQFGHLSEQKRMMESVWAFYEQKFFRNSNK